MGDDPEGHAVADATGDGPGPGFVHDGQPDWLVESVVEPDDVAGLEPDELVDGQLGPDERRRDGDLDGLEDRGEPGRVGRLVAAGLGLRVPGAGREPGQEWLEGRVRIADGQRGGLAGDDYKVLYGEPWTSMPTDQGALVVFGL